MADKKVTEEMVEKLLKEPIDESKYYIPKMFEKDDKEKK